MHGIRFVGRCFNVRHPGSFPGGTCRELSFRFPSLALGRIEGTTGLTCRRRRGCEGGIVSGNGRVVTGTRGRNGGVFILTNEPCRVSPRVGRKVSELVSNFSITVIDRSIVSPEIRRFQARILGR